jgi:hypothetical protein
LLLSNQRLKYNYSKYGNLPSSCGGAVPAMCTAVPRLAEQSRTSRRNLVRDVPFPPNGQSKPTAVKVAYGQILPFERISDNDGKSLGLGKYPRTR